MTVGPLIGIVNVVVALVHGSTNVVIRFWLSALKLRNKIKNILKKVFNPFHIYLGNFPFLINLTSILPQAISSAFFVVIPIVD